MKLLLEFLNNFTAFYFSDKIPTDKIEKNTNGAVHKLSRIKGLGGGVKIANFTW